MSTVVDEINAPISSKVYVGHLIDEITVYEDLLALLNRYKYKVDAPDVDVDAELNIREKIENRIYQAKLSLRFDIPIPPRSSVIPIPPRSGSKPRQPIELSEYESIGIYGGPMSNRQIARPDGGVKPSIETHPEGETLYVIALNTGAYTEGRNYDPGCFGKFFQKLKTYNPKYVDTANSTLYYPSSNGTASIMYGEFKHLLKDYQWETKEELRRQEITRLRDKIDSLEKERGRSELWV